MNSYTLNEKELRWVLTRIYEYQEGCPDSVIQEFESALVEYRVRLLTGYKKPDNEDII